MSDQFNPAPYRGDPSIPHADEAKFEARLSSGGARRIARCSAGSPLLSPLTALASRARDGRGGAEPWEERRVIRSDACGGAGCFCTPPSSSILPPQLLMFGTLGAVVMHYGRNWLGTVRPMFT